MEAPLCETALLRAIVENSDDAILTKNLSGVITSWNKGAERLFGYSAGEVLGHPVQILLPPDRHDEAEAILQRIWRGERIEHFETVRQHRDGTLIPISLTISPLLNEAGEVVGASKIARNIAERKQAEEMQRLLIGEMQHRIKNVFSLAGSLVSLSAGRAATKEELVTDVRSRLRALSAAYELTVPMMSGSTVALRQSTFYATVAALFGPYLVDEDQERLSMQGPDLTFASKAITPVALLVNELITNAMKHGALRDGDGRIAITTALHGDQVQIQWDECHSHMGAESELTEKGFGSALSRLAVEQQLGGTLSREWRADGLHVRVTFPTSNLEPRRD